MSSQLLFCVVVDKPFYLLRKYLRHRFKLTYFDLLSQHLQRFLFDVMTHDLAVVVVVDVGVALDHRRRRRADVLVDVTDGTHEADTVGVAVGWSQHVEDASLDLFFQYCK